MEEEKITIFTIPDIVRFLYWAESRYRLEGMICAGNDYALIELIKEYVEFTRTHSKEV